MLYENRATRLSMVVIVTVLLVFLAGIFLGIAIRTRSLLHESILIQARSHFKSIVLTRQWNALHGGVYVLKSEGIKSNPYLEKPDLTARDGKVYTMKNPALMTREISELAGKEGMFQFHITSLRPLNPGNAADAFETKALQGFENGESEVYDFAGSKLFRYMAPLYVEKSCLTCHAKQGYKEGQVRGGISVTLNVAHIEQQLNQNMRLIAILGTVMSILLTGVIFYLIMRLVKVLSTARAHIERMAVTDELTGIYNRRHGMDRLEQEFSKCSRHATELSCIMMDLDHFKQINDTYGHHQGDVVLKEIANMVTVTLRAYDIFFRYGGEEFVIVLPLTPEDQAYLLAERLRRLIKGVEIPVLNKKEVISITVSFGVSGFRNSDTNMLDILDRADKALYEAKDSGRDRVCIFGRQTSDSPDA